MSASASPTPAIPVGVANQFTFHDSEHATQITYYPFGFGPIVQGQGPGPKLDYKGQEGGFSFSGTQIQVTSSPLGNLITVDLRPHIAGDELLVTLVLPDVTMTQPKENFKTIIVKTAFHRLVVAPGADRTYSVLHMNGVAATVGLPQ